jgi:hypothetical protein
MQYRVIGENKQPTLLKSRCGVYCLRNGVG